jgi:copper homeostasis protein
MVYFGMNYKLEICVDSSESAFIAQEAGADRVELCDNLTEGGTTPSLGTIMTIRKGLKIALNVIIRPRGGDFVYSSTEIEIMKKDIEICREVGADGVVLGILKKDGNIDVERTSELIKLARPMSVTYHRAFDMCYDPVKGLEDIIKAGADRLLTSGQKNSAYEGLDLIAGMVKQAGGRIIIMAGGGINLSNIEKVIRESNATEFHLTARKIKKSKMDFFRNDISLGRNREIHEYSRKVADDLMIRKIVRMLKEEKNHSNI